jgi:AcrR family transcriptional regulator
VPTPNPSTPRRPYTPRLPPEQRREQLLDAALTIIARDGYAGVSIESIAREAGVTRPVVYSVFAGLGPLLYALLDRQEQRALAQLLAAVPSDWAEQDPGAVLLVAVRQLIDVVRRDPLTWRPVLLTGGGTPAAVTERIARDRELVRGQIRALLEAGIAAGGLPPLDAEIVSHALIGIAEYFGRKLVEDPEGFDADRLTAAIADAVSVLRR